MMGAMPEEASKAPARARRSAARASSEVARARESGGVAGMAAAESVAVVDEPHRLATALSPIRSRLLAALSVPDSAAGLARRLGLPRQKANYHLRELEKGGFVTLCEERQRRGCTERILRVTARTFVIDPKVLPDAPPDGRSADRLSSAWLLHAA